MQTYGSNKLKTACDIVRRIDNWPTALGLRLRRRRPGLRLLNFRDGLNVVCRGDTRDWDVIHELLFAGGYGRAMNWLKGRPGKPLVLDLGGNIGLFSLLAASTHPMAEVYSYEPGPPNLRLFEMNRLANEKLTDRIHLCREAVAGRTRMTEWFFDVMNPAGSSIYSGGSSKFTVQIRAFTEVMDSLPNPPELVKIDIEGAEFELLAATPPHVWQGINAISLELHNDPEGNVSWDEFLKRMAGYGYKAEDETVCSFFLYR